MTRKVEYLEEAVQDAEAAAKWYAERSITASVVCSTEIDAAEAAILERPEAWPQLHHGTRRYLLRRFPFSIVYKIEPSRLLILAVAYARRRPGYWKQRGAR